jgi:hypothetical protein
VASGEWTLDWRRHRRWQLAAGLAWALSAHAQDAPSAAVVETYRPVTASGRLRWFALSTAGPQSLLLTGPVSAGIGTWRDRPPEYGPGVEGFGKRYGMRLTGLATGNAIEAALGAAWGEDPRYFRSPEPGFRPRMKRVVIATFLAPGRDGAWRPAYARFAGNVSSNFLSNTWRARGESRAQDAAMRCLWGLTGRMAANAFREFWPGARKKFLRR